MVRELAISLYLLIIRLLFNFFKLFPLTSKTTFVTSFGWNVHEVTKALDNQLARQEIVILTDKGCNLSFADQKTIPFQSYNLIHFVQSIYHLATSSYIFVDNYFGILAATNFKAEVKCVQLWHANGALKQFGLEDLTNEHRSSLALARFQKVYDRFSHVVVGSEKMKDIFKSSFGLPEERFIRTGVPRTDLFFNEEVQDNMKAKLLTDFPVLREKKMILYAPTYRDGVFSADEIALNIEQLEAACAKEYVLFLRLHPAVESKLDFEHSAFVYDVSAYENINQLLVGTDVLITDYSSIPFEFCLLERPMIFFAYDYEEYARDRGLWLDYAGRVPGPVAETTNDIINILEAKDFQLEKVRAFSSEWNTYSKGASAANLLATIYEDAAEQVQIRDHG